jgi:serine protease inhibitor
MLEKLIIQENHMNKTLLSLQKYATDFYSGTEFGESNIVSSPLGSWLLVASVASGLDLSNNSPLKEDIEKTLHMSIEEASNAVKEILEQYRELNYVSQAWTAPNLSSLPAVQKWVEANTLLPHEGNIPSQEKIDEWASTNTNDLIKKFPSEMNEATMVVIANIIYSKLAWKTQFKTVPANEQMSRWGVENVLVANATEDVKFVKDMDGNVYASYRVKATGDKESVSLVTSLSGEDDPKKLMDVIGNIEEMEELTPDEAALNCSKDIFRVKEVRRGTTPTVIIANVPAWDAESEHSLLANKALGYQSLFEAFGEGSEGGFDAQAKQVAVAKFDKDGFEAAALTSMVMARCAMPSLVTQTVYELNFGNPFVFVSHLQKLPVFSGYICNAKEG